jgi:hypothetical protein
MDDFRDHGDETDHDGFEHALSAENQEAVARLRAVVDLSAMNMREHSRIVVGYWNALLEQGIQPSVALSLTLNFQSVYFGSLLS